MSLLTYGDDIAIQQVLDKLGDYDEFALQELLEKVLARAENNYNTLHQLLIKTTTITSSNGDE